MPRYTLTFPSNKAVDEDYGIRISTMTQILLKGGTALIHDANEKVDAVKANILIKGNKISEIGANISASQADVIDCTDKIISPGFIDTHHHGTYID